jgi:hypothetical protein
MNDTKNILIRGGAITDFTKERKTRKRRSQEQHGGYDVPSPTGAIPFTEANLGRVQKLVSKMIGGSAPAVAPPVAPPVAPSAAPGPAMLAPPKLPQVGGKPKLILEPKKKSMKKLHLAPASVSGRRSVAKTRKIRVNLHGMKRRLTRAKEIHKDSRHKDIDHIKKTLIDAKLIKARAEGKPESTDYDMMLRKTYENYMLLRNRAL